MIYFSLGLPGRLSDWCDAAIVRLAALGGRKVASAAPGDGTDGLDDAALSLIRSNADCLVMTARHPDGRLTEMLGDAPFILALDDPRATFAGLPARDRSVAAARDLANSCPFLMQLAGRMGALAIGPRDVGGDALATLGRIAAHLGIAAADADLTAILAAIKPLALEIRDWSADLPEPLAKLVDGALGGYGAFFAGGPFGDLVWSREFFCLGRDGAQYPKAPVPLRDTGNGRFLIYGPYLNLPPGYWSAKIVLGVSAEAVGQTLTVDAFSGRLLAVAKFLPKAGGVFTADINFAVDVTDNRKIEIRILVGRDSAPGELAFGHVVLHPIALHHQDAVAGDEGDFHAALQL